MHPTHALRATPANDGRSRMTRLSQRASLSLPAFVARPAYDRSKLHRGLVHLGLGAFHRAHQAIYTDAAMANGDLRWGIAGVSLRSKSVAEALIPQDLLYNVLERDGEQVNARLVGALHAALYAPSQLHEVLDAIADPRTQVVTTTVTEKGYCIKSGHRRSRHRRQGHPARLCQSRFAGLDNRRTLCRHPPPGAGSGADCPLLRQHGHQRRHAAQAHAAVCSSRRPRH